MEKYLTNFVPRGDGDVLSQKREKNDEELKEVSREYEKNKRRRDVQAHWTKDFHWLITADKIMYCQKCRSVYGHLSVKSLPQRYDKYRKGQFVTGSTNLKKHTLNDHQDSFGHIEACRIYANRNAKKGSTEAEKALSCLRKGNVPYLRILFRSAHYMAKMKKIKLYSDVMSCLQHLYAFYKNYLQRSNLKKTFISLKMDTVLPTRVGGTRWVQFTNTALRNLIKGLKAYNKHLSEVQAAGDSVLRSKAKALLKKLQQREVILFSHFLCELTQSLTALSCAMQAREATLHECKIEIASCHERILNFHKSPGFYLRKVIDEDRQPCAAFEHAKSEYLDSIASAMKNRYMDLEEGLLAATSLVNFKLWPSSIEENKDFGDDKVLVVLDQYGEMMSGVGLKPDAVEHELTSLRGKLYHSDIKISSMTWSDVNEKWGEGHTNFLGAIDLLLSLPASTAECERGFRLMKQIKTAYRNRLKASTMSDLVTVQMHSPSIEEFDPDPYIAAWHPAQRRPRKISDAKLIKAAEGPSVDTVSMPVVHDKEMENAEDVNELSDYCSGSESSLSENSEQEFDIV